jgi:hypothetical protein
MDIRELPIDELVLDPSLNLRDRLDDFTVERYADAWQRMPPITVFEIEGQWLLADGFHRHAAAVMLAKRSIPAEVREGTMADALDFVASVNLFHGLPLTRSERRRAVEVKLRIHPDWSDRRLAEELAIGRELIGKIRKMLVDSGQISAAVSRVGADGKTYTSAGLPRDPNERLPTTPATEAPASRTRPPGTTPATRCRRSIKGGRTKGRLPPGRPTTPEPPRSLRRRCRRPRRSTRCWR